MYSYEIEQYLKEHNYYLTGEESMFLTNPQLNPQIARVRYNSQYDFYEIWTVDGWYFKFGVKPYVRKLEKP